ncbi:MAG TPA: inositol monophosphatase family protein, partial [Gemmatimonadales bacterium]|nr:inositol monophosphatase family protein [Gemmatimonadales bacterium]
MKNALDLLIAAGDAARRAGEYLRTVERPADPAAWGVKGPGDFVSEVDRECEALVAELIRARFPESTVVGEELSPEVVREGLVWIVDPLDGTTNFLHGYPQYAVSIAAAVDGVLEAGVVYDVTRDACYAAARGHGAFGPGNRRLAVSAIREPGHALLGTGFPFKYPELLPEYLPQLDAILRRTAGVRRAGSAALDLADVALGRLDGFWELRLAPWDLAAGTL